MMAPRVAAGYCSRSLSDSTCGCVDSYQWVRYETKGRATTDIGTPERKWNKVL